MLIQHTLTTLKGLRLFGMAHAFEEQLAQSAFAALSFEERIGLLVDREIADRDNRRLTRLLKKAKLKDSRACLEDLDYRASRGLDRAQMASLATMHWVRSGQSLLITGATGCGKTWLASAFGNQAARQGLSVQYLRTSRLFEELRIAHADGSFKFKLAALAKIDLLLLDDWALAPMTASDRADLLEILDDRVNSKSTLITSQLPVEHWHEYLHDPTLADAILDRVLHSSHRIKLTGDSLRKRQENLTQRERLD